MIRPPAINLARRPFRNNTAYYAVYTACLALLLTATAYNGWRFFAGGSELGRLREDVSFATERYMRMHDEVEEMKKQINTLDLAVINTKSSFAEGLILSRFFSWSLLFDRLEDLIPPEVKIQRIAPAISTKRIEITLAGMSRSPDAFLEFEKMIAIRRAGFEGRDLQAATEKGVVVTNNPGANAESVADMAIGLMLSVSKQIAQKDREMRRGLYPRGSGSEDLFRKTVGIIGLGNIGKRVAKRLQGFEVKVIANDILEYPDFQKQYNIPYYSKEVLLQKADFVTIHVPLDPSTRGMINEERLRFMKKTSFLINTARGPIVDEKALYKALKEGWIAGAGLDVFETEPPVFRDHILLDNVASTPHSARLSNQASYAMAMETVKKVITLFAGKIPENVLNPEVLKKLELSA